MFAVGVTILFINVLMGVFAPEIASRDPVRDLQLADDYAMPSWMAMFYPDLPRNVNLQVIGADWTTQVTGINTGLLAYQTQGESLRVTYTGNGSQQAAVNQVMLTKNFEFPYSPPRTFIVTVPFAVRVSDPSAVNYRLQLAVKNLQSQENFVIYDTFPPWRTSDAERIGDALLLHSRDAQIARRLGMDPLLSNVAQTVFANKGSYRVEISFHIKDTGSNKVQLAFEIAPVRIKVQGLLFGALGTNNVGADVFSQLVYGARVSLIVGFLSVSIAVILGLIIGVVAGYRGGIVDQLLMFFTDTVLQTPTLPIILLVILVFGRNLYLIIAILALMSWPSLARQMRAWVLSLKERAFVEAARAIGASDLYIMFRVIAPQTVPLIAYVFILGVPSAVFIEIGLSLIGFGDPFLPSWGKMINEAFYGGAYTKLAWWWVAPPIAAILLLALCFVLIGFTLEETIQPTLRAR